MKGLLLGLLASASMSPDAPVGVVVSPRAATQSAYVASDWQLSSQLGEQCNAHAVGAVTDVEGAALALQCVATGTPARNVLGNVAGHFAAQSLRQRRVTLTAEIQTQDAMTVSLWLKTQHGTRTLMFDDDSEQSLLSDANAGWVRRTITLPVAADATQVSFGVLLQGKGSVNLRDIHLTASAPGAIAPEAAQLLDAAISIVKQHGAGRDLSWQVLEPQLRLFASGAQTSAEVYPAIKYLLARLGDKRSLLLTPEVATALEQIPAVAAANKKSTVTVFSLPDGARLVLARAPELVRTADIADKSALARP